MFRFVLTFTLIFATQSLHAQALPRFAYQQAEAFAICSGRMSAMAVRLSADRDPAAPETRQMMQEFDVLLEAVLDAAYADGVPEREPRRWKARGWTEVAQLLRNEAGHSLLQQRLRDCENLVLPS
jgi:hypothetical protein